jgi:hypothetical protein
MKPPQELEEWARDECHSVFYTNESTSCDCPFCGGRARYEINPARDTEGAGA